MASRQPRLDAYGSPLPMLADARHEVLKDRPHNHLQRRLLLAALEEQWGLVLRRGVYADVTVRLIVIDGMIADPVDVGSVRHWRHGGDE